jgi:hypothetical protein
MSMMEVMFSVMTVAESSKRTSERSTKRTSGAEFSKFFRSRRRKGVFNALRFGAEFVLEDVERRREHFRVEESAEGLAWDLDLEEWVLVILGGFASFTEIKVRAYGALVSGSSNWLGLASITGNASMNDLSVGVGFVSGFRSFSGKFSEQLLFKSELELETSLLALKSFLFFRSKLSLNLFKFGLFGFSELSFNKLLGEFLSFLEGFA